MSEWKEDSIRRRDFRHTHGEPEVPISHSKTKTKKWCKGKVGREHIPIKVPHYIFGKVGWVITKCDICGKHLGYYYPIFDRFPP